MFKGVNSSPKSKAETLMVATSFAIPAIDMGTAPTRWMILDRHDDGSGWSEGETNE